MELQQDFRELLELFNKHEVSYVIVGAYALAMHGVPRYTGDLDILVKSDKENSQRILVALVEFGFGSMGLSESDFIVADNVIQLGVPPVRVDIITSLTGVSWAEVYAHRIAGNYGDTPVYFIGREQFITNKRALGRKKDLADLEELGEE
ncbi:MAG: hypothetical protein J7K40_05805 [candidate division Zixibacteria bacterium]|nr:hypothetical protein [candidate division Zixibacteria bacterium]